MAYYSQKVIIWFFLVLVANIYMVVYGQLSPNYYSNSCPKVFSIINEVVSEAISNKTRNGALLLRLHFHDCFVNGCDASILLDNIERFSGEKKAIPNANSLKGFFVIDKIKARLEKACPGVVSCADILAVSARDSVVNLGGPSWPVALGRRDAKTANGTDANLDLPNPNQNLTGLVLAFKKKGFTVQEMVALSGSHTIGFARCTTFRNRLYNESIDPSFAKSLKEICPQAGNDTSLASFDTTESHFDNSYFKNLLLNRGLLHTDQQLFRHKGAAADQVKLYSTRPLVFFQDFANAMVKMSKINPLTGKDGEVRIHCRKFNAYHTFTKTTVSNITNATSTTTITTTTTTTTVD